MRRRVWAVLTAVAAGMFLPLLLPAAPAHAAGRMDLSPSRGPAGTSVTITFVDYGVICWIKVTWDSPDGPQLAFIAPWDKTTTVTVPADASAGTHTIHTEQCLGRVQTTFEVVPPTPPSPNPPPPGPQPPPPPGPRPPQPPQASPTPAPGRTPTPGPSPSSAAAAPPAVPGLGFAPQPEIVRRGGALALDRDFIRPGQELTARGTGCPAASPVRISSGGREVAATTADPNGVFQTELQFTEVEAGRRVVTASCGKLQLTADVDVVLSTATDGPLSAAVPLFVLAVLGSVAVGWQHATLRGQPGADALPGPDVPADALPGHDVPDPDVPGSDGAASLDGNQA